MAGPRLREACRDLSGFVLEFEEPVFEDRVAAQDRQTVLRGDADSVRRIRRGMRIEAVFP